MADNQKDGSKLTKDGKVVSEILVGPYGEPELSRPETANVNDNRGGKSTLAVSVKLPIKAIGAIMPCSVYARLQPDGQVKFDPALPKGFVMGDEHRDVFRATINRALLGWSGRERAFSEAYKRLTAAPRPKGEKPAESESLVWKPETALQSDDKTKAA